MFFILSKILFFLLVPFWWIVLLLIWMMLTKSATRKKRLRIAIILLLIVFTNPFIYRSVVLLWQPEPVALGAKKYSAAILLGGMADYDKYDRGHFGGSSDRFIQAANLYHTGAVQKIIVTGGTGSLRQNEPPESDFLRKEFIRNGVPDSAIVIESRSRNTYENGVYTKKIVDSLHLQPPFLLVTSALHMRRSEQVFKKAGFRFETFPCDFRVMPVKPVLEKYIAPSPEVLVEWPDFIKEVVGLYVYKFTGKA